MKPSTDTPFAMIYGEENRRRRHCQQRAIFRFCYEIAQPFATFGMAYIVVRLRWPSSTRGGAFLRHLLRIWNQEFSRTSDCECVQFVAYSPETNEVNAPKAGFVCQDVAQEPQN